MKSHIGSQAIRLATLDKLRTRTNEERKGVVKTLRQHMADTYRSHENLSPVGWGEWLGGRGGVISWVRVINKLSLRHLLRTDKPREVQRCEKTKDNF